MEINSVAELIALKKAIVYIKFGLDDADRVRLAGSPYLTQLLQKSHESLTDYYKSKNSFYEPTWSHIEQFEEALKQVKNNLILIDNWNQLSDEIRISVIKEYCSPFYVSESTIEDLKRLK